MILKRLLFLIAPFWSATLMADPTLTMTPDKTSAIYQVGDKITWTVQATGDDAAPITTASYVLKKGGGTVIDQGTLTFTDHSATIQTTPDAPCTILAEVTASGAAPGQKGLDVFAGAAVSPEKIDRSAPMPDDFDSFWKSKLDELAAVPENVVLEKVDSERPGVDYWKVTMDNIRGTHIQAQLARPSGDAKCPAAIAFQYAGVYPFQKKWVTDQAAQGWIVLNVNAHDLPLDQPAAFYADQNKGALKNYPMIGADDREKSYFLRMFLACYRSVEYISERPDWDGKTIEVNGASQGGLQSFVAAGLNPKVTALCVLVPAGCDDTGALVGRGAGWPFFMNGISKDDTYKQRIISTSRYFDAVNFASHIKCPALIGLGLIDVTAPPSGVFTAINQLQGPKEVVVLPLSDHHGANNSQKPYWMRLTAWHAALGKGDPAPVNP